MVLLAVGVSLVEVRMVRCWVVFKFSGNTGHAPQVVSLEVKIT
jgi:hypothetical protein